eukprot:GHVT01027946.1.p1 GENE.GHVT01027946.1~~GHVT01027946.1.p1  ORF type:complete len:708 (+),score=150.96 GHVT01027946.1:232-2355(+)
MGGIQSAEFSTRQTYAVPLENSETPDASAIYRAVIAKKDFVTNWADDPAENCWDLFQRGVSKCAEQPCLGTRSRQPDGTLGDYTWKTYREVERLALQFGSGLIGQAGVPIREFPEETAVGCGRLRPVGIFMKNCEAWIVTELAACAFGFTIVPLYDTLGTEASVYIINQTELRTVVCSIDCAQMLLKESARCPTVKLLIVVGVNGFAGYEAAAAEGHDLGIRLAKWQDMLDIGAASPVALSASGDFALPRLEAINTICYTSGTTGMPKGVVLSHDNFVSAVAAAIQGPLNSPDLFVDENDVHLSYLPLAHIYERLFCNILLSSGSRLGFFGGDTQKLVDDLGALRPTIFTSVPRLYNRIFDKVSAKVAAKGGVAARLFQWGLATKVQAAAKDGKVKNTFWDALLFSKTKAMLGGRVRFMVNGSAPLDSSVKESVRCIFCSPLLEGYGMTESMGGSFVSTPLDPDCTSIGGIMPCVEYRLASIPSMNYFATPQDAQKAADANPKVPKTHAAAPIRGEVCLRGRAVTKGYFKNQAETKLAISPDGWLFTGDVAEFLPNGALKIIDRKKNIFKLAQGEYVAPEKIESVLLQATLVAQIFVHGNSKEASLVALVVPDGPPASAWAQANGQGALALEEICKTKTFKAAVLQELNSVGRSHGLKGFELPRALHLCATDFGGLDLLTPTFKLKRHPARLHFAKEIDELYQQLAK